jgi:phage terminase large subunit
MDHTLQTTELYFWTAESEKPIIVHQGGTSSGKTYAILQYLILECCYNQDLVVTVVGQDIPNLRVGAYRDAQNIINSDPYFQQEMTDHNKSNRVFTFKSGSG